MTDLRLQEPDLSTSGVMHPDLLPAQCPPAAERPRLTPDVGRAPNLAYILAGTGLASALLERTANASPPSGNLSLVSNWKSPELWLVRRITNGLNGQEATLAKKMGFTAYLERQLNDTAINDTAADGYVALNYPLLTLTPAQLRGQYSKLQVAESTLYRAVFSQRQLRQRMVEFWHDHFNVNISKCDMVVYDRDVIRANAMGKFPDLLRAVAHSPAMLFYLDNTASRKEAPNQNFARELMELHTLGSSAFSQQDVKEVARCFTGWTQEADPAKANYGQFVFDATLHDNNSKVVLGHLLPAGGGLQDGEQVLNILASHPATATLIATKMLHWLLREDPPVALVQQIAQVYATTGGDIRAMIRAILTPALLQAAPPKFKRPIHLVASMMRTTSATMVNLSLTRQNIDNMGQPFMGWVPPNGYPDTQAYWTSFILPRWNFALNLMNSQAGDLRVDCKPFLSLPTMANVVSWINATLFAGEMSPTLTSSLAAFLTQNPYGDARITAVALALASPEFQWY